MRVKNIGIHSYYGLDGKVPVSIGAGESVEVSDEFGKYLLSDTESPGSFEKSKDEKAK